MILFVNRRQQLWLLFGVLALVNTIAVGRALYDFAHHGGARQGAFLGEHDLAALSTMTLAGALVDAVRTAHPRLVVRGAPGWSAQSGSRSEQRSPSCSGSTSRSPRSSRSPLRAAP